MRRISPRFRLLVLVLAMHLAHVPVPMWDAGDGLDRCSSTCIRGVAALCCWDLDLLLLGIDPPENLDDGPVDSEPESPQAEFVSPERGNVRGCLQWGAIDPSESLTAAPAPLGAMISLPARVPAPRLTSYSASFVGSHPWWRLLRVMTV
jgi:hypothetical protein